MNGKLLLEHTAKWKVMYIAILFASLSFLGVKAIDTYSPTVMSDKDDYAPGEVAIISGYGWTEDQFVDIHFEETPAYHEEHLHDYHNVAVDADGKWMIKYQIEERHLGVAFDVHVVGKQSNAEAHTRFTDGNVSFNASGLPNGTSVTVLHNYTVPNKNVELKPTSVFTTPTASEAIASSNSGTVFLSYPKLITANTKKYVVTGVTAVSTANNGNTTNLTVTSVESGDYDYSFTSPAQATTVSAFYKRETSVAATNVSGQQGGTVILSASLKESGANLSGKLVRFTFNGVNYTSPATNNGGNTNVIASIGNLAVGSYSYTAAFLEDADFAGSTTTGTVTVTSACTTPSVSTQPAASTITYGGNATFSATASGTAPLYQWQVNTGDGFINVEGATSTTLTLMNPSVAMSGNQYRCVVTNSCGTATSTAATLTVAKAAATVSFVASSLNQTYSGAPLSVSASTLPANLAIDYTYNASSIAPTAADSYIVVGTVNDANYQGSAEGTLVIAKKALAVTVNSKERVYNVANPTLDGEFTGAVVSDGISVSYTTTATQSSNVGDYPITATLDDPNNKLANYTVNNIAGNLKVTPAQATISVSDLAKTYNGSAQGATITTSPAGLDATVTYNGSAAAPTAANTYDVVAVLNNSNYSAADGTGTLVIAQKEVTVTLANAGKVYDGSTTATGTTATLTGVISPDNVSTTVSEEVYSTAGAGPTTVTAKVELAGADKANYKLASITPGNTAITPKALIASITAEDKVYDGSKVATVSATLAGKIDGDQVSVTPSHSLFADKNVGVGKGVTADIQIGGIDAGNYTVNSIATTTASITARPIAVAAVEKSKVYGDNDPALTYSLTSGDLVAGDGFTGSLLRVTGENVGNYAIEQHELSAGVNYAITFTGANFEITKAPLTVTANNDSRFCGQQNAAFTGTIAGIKRSDAITATYTSDANAMSAAGTYAIVPAAAGANLGNYEVTLVNGVLTVGNVVVDASANSTPQAIKNTATTITIKVVDAAGTAAANVPVNLYFDNGTGVEVSTNGSGDAIFFVGTLQPGVYKIRAVAGAGCSESTVYLPVYDPNGGFVTGGGWIDSPAGAYKANTDLTGKAHFGFVAKYKKGTTVPDGNTEFQFQAGNLNFNSSAYDDMRLVVAGAKANYKGTGKINGVGNYGFMVSAVDGQATNGGGVDKFRIKIWDKDNGDAVVYDNNVLNTDEDAEPATALGGGSIVIHEAKAVTAAPGVKKAEAAGELAVLSTARFDNYPNAFSDQTTIRFALDTEQNFALEVYDIRGALVKKVGTGIAEAGKVYEYQLDARNLAEGVYFARLATGFRIQTIKMLLKK